jgi:hypothetical protein
MTGYKASEFEKAYSIGAKAAFDLAKKHSGSKDQEELNNSPLLMVITGSKIYLSINNTDVRKYGEERYVHIRKY